MSDKEREIEYEDDDFVEVSTELDGRGDAEFTNPGDPLVDDEESIDGDLLDGTDNDFDTADDIDTLEIDDPDAKADDLDDDDYEVESDADEADEL
jgi:hypothetical protein